MSPFVATSERLPHVRLCQTRDHDIADEVVHPLDPTTNAPAGRVAVVQRVPRSAGDPQPRAAHAATADAIAEQVPSRTVAGQPAAGIVQQCHHPVVVDTAGTPSSGSSGLRWRSGARAAGKHGRADSSRSTSTGSGH